MISRDRHVRTVRHLLQDFPVVAILGPRQVGKTTLARQVAQTSGGPTHHFDLEDLDDLARLAEAKLALGPLRGLVVLDEVQRLPAIFQTLRVLADRPNSDTRFLVLGSASPQLLRQSSETLAGRVAFHHLPGFSLDEIGEEALDQLWLRGGFPRSFLASSGSASTRWRREFIRTFLERDLPQLGSRIPGITLHRFWTMLAHYHGDVLNLAELARAFAVSNHTVRSYLDLLTSTFVVFQLPPWHQNLGKRQVKRPKVYLSDTGLLHTLLGLSDREALLRHPKVGASWEGFALTEVVRCVGAHPSECWFWATHQGAELDLLITQGGSRRGFEFKLSSAPRRTKSMTIALDDLHLDELVVVHAGEHVFPMGERLRAVPLARLDEELG